MKPAFLLVALTIALTGCGIKRPLIAPKDIPEYERKRQEKIEKLQPVPEAMLQQTGAA